MNAFARRVQLSVGLALLCFCVSAAAQVEVLSGVEQHVFGGETQEITIALRNSGPERMAVPVRIRLQQTTSSTVAPFATRDWKTIQMLPGQTILEVASIEFPAVRGETDFLVQWTSETRILGVTRVHVYPTNLLDELKALLADDGQLGILDPKQRIVPQLQQSGISVRRIEEADLPGFDGRIVILGPFDSVADTGDTLRSEIQGAVKRGVAVVWLRSGLEHRQTPEPSFYVVPHDVHGVVVARAELVADFSRNPQSQLNLVHFCKLALHPEPPRLPEIARTKDL